MKCFGFKNTRIYIEGKGIVKTSLQIQDGKISSIGKDESKELIEFDDSYIVVPGFIDKHIHGAGKADFMNPSKRQIKKILDSIVKEGTTSCLATTMTQSLDTLFSSLKVLRDYIEENPKGVEILGIHLEGPFISPKYAGAQPRDYILPCSVDIFDKLNKQAGNHIKEVTLAVEENGMDLVKHLVKQNIVASLGHTDCTYVQAKEAVLAGATSISHMFNAMRGLHHREAGAVGAGLLHKELNCELICDGKHVLPPVVNLLYQAKQKTGISLITDAMEAKWMPDGIYQLGGQEVIVSKGMAKLKDGTLAGSILKMNEAIYRFMQITNCSLTDAIDLATINPANCLHIADKKGSIAVGKDADLVVIDQKLNVYMTVCRGEIIYSKM
ncbi:MAG: N-acetylglucosamine-6-phosphate deacetylase [Roseburia sp.]|nr:N-acetylglucosamine-6-phosphate deacetylase [Anaeroplasma bactoclasticum]MCM1195612.1 N-acetylglucosamine-6-phosphate deacetylase [Roseburia sp.]MCM1556202.1 N-acetylglucosamine-6-phosphate deacetylase [Anaeroplasma bactoclasticum]